MIDTSQTEQEKSRHIIRSQRVRDLKFRKWEIDGANGELSLQARAFTFL